jgi:O-antigen/teichoic acid export membrane protein
MRARKAVRETEREVIDIARRLRKRDFRGNTGTAIKNSSWRIATLLVAKIGSLLFTIIIARLLMPELYGLYGLALSTILLIGAFADLGIAAAITTFISKTIDKEKGKAKAYFYYLNKIRFSLMGIAILIILVMGNWIANDFYQKPIYFALLAGIIYLPLTYISRFFGVLFISRNNFKIDFVGEIVLQISRLTILPLLIFYVLTLSLKSEIILFWIFVGLSLSLFITGAYYYIRFLSNNPFKNIKKQNLTKKEKEELWQFILPLTITVFSGVFFGYIDTVMLGRYVASEFIGFYHAAFNLIVAASAIIGFSAAAMFPIFSRLKGARLHRGFRKARNITFLISLLALIFTVIVAPFLIQIVYGEAYKTSVLYLRLFSLLLISFPLIALYQTYYTSQKRTKIISVLLIISTVINVILNFVFINIGLSYGMKEAVLGACFATIIARYSYLAGLVLWRRRRG